MQNNEIYAHIEEIMKIVQKFADKTTKEQLHQLLNELYTNPTQAYFIFKDAKKALSNGKNLEIKYESFGEKYGNMSADVDSQIKLLHKKVGSISPSKFNNLKDGFVQKMLPNFLVKSNKEKYVENFQSVRNDLASIETELIKNKINIGMVNYSVEKALSLYNEIFEIHAQYLYLVKNAFQEISNKKHYQYIPDNLHQYDQNIQSLLYEEITSIAGGVVAIANNITASEQMLNFNTKYLGLIDVAISNTKLYLNQANTISHTLQFDEVTINNLTKLSDEVTKKIADSLNSMEHSNIPNNTETIGVKTS